MQRYRGVVRGLSPVFGALSLLLLSAEARGAGNSEKHLTAPAGGGLEEVEVTVDQEAGALKIRRGGANGAVKSVPIKIDRTRIDLANASMELLPIGEGRSVIHARITDIQRKDLAFEAIVAGNSDEPIFAGLTGHTQGEDGDRSGQVVLVYDRDDKSKFVLVAEAREDTRICGQTTTPLGARGLDPKTMQLRGATLHRLDKKDRDGAVRVIGQAHAGASKAPLARILFATGGSAPNAQAVTDGKPDTTWSEKRPGDGHGEFVTMRAPSEVPIHSFTVTIAPSQASAQTPKEGAAPRTFYVATDQKLFHVTMPEDAWSKPGATYDVTLPAPVRTTCVAIVLDEAYSRNLAAPEVSFAEMSAVSKFDLDGASLDDVAKELSTGARAEESAALLRRGGEDGLAAVSKRWSTLDPRGRALAVDVAASAGTCEGAAMELLTRALADKESEVRKRALGRIERCGKAATESLVLAVKSDEEPRRAASAPLLATIAPGAALEPIGDELGKGSTDTRRALRGAFSRASASAPRDKLLALLMKKEALPLTARLDLLRAMSSKLPDLRPEAGAAIADILRASPAPDMPTRWLVLQPLASLARSQDATSGELTRVSQMIQRDPDWPVRARAIELSAGIAPLAPAILAAGQDPEPRVREAAMKAIASGKISSGAGAAAQALSADTWTFVRVSAAEALGAIPENALGQNALAEAVEKDGSAKVRASAVTALGAQRAVKFAAKIRDRLDDTKEDTEVRALAARTLGAMCVRSATDRLTKLAILARSPVDEADERIGMAAIEALSALHPPDLEKRLAPLREKEVRTPIKRAAERVLSEQGTCR